MLNARAFTAEDVEENGAISHVEMEMQRIEVGKTYKIHDIYYTTNSADIEARSTPILDEFIAFLKENSSIKVAIHGHTDNVGNDRDNLGLSTERAFMVMEYLQGQGVSSSRLSFKGFGSSKPVVSNATPEGRALNRRTEFVVTGK